MTNEQASVITDDCDLLVIDLGQSMSNDAERRINKAGWSVEGAYLRGAKSRFPTLLPGDGNLIKMVFDGDHALVLQRHPLDIWFEYRYEARVMRMNEWRKLNALRSRNQ